MLCQLAGKVQRVSLTDHLQWCNLSMPVSGAVLELDVPQASRLVRRLLMDGFLGFARTQLLVLLADAGDRSRQDANAAQVRPFAPAG